jgi:hypothetical protein
MLASVASIHRYHNPAAIIMDCGQLSERATGVATLRQRSNVSCPLPNKVLPRGSCVALSRVAHSHAASFARVNPLCKSIIGRRNWT